MTATITQSAINVRAGLFSASKVAGVLQAPVLEDGDGSETDFSLPQGLKPYSVHNNGSLSVEGASEDYTVLFDGFIYTVRFAVAPGNGNSVATYPVEA